MAQRAFDLVGRLPVGAEHRGGAVYQRLRRIVAHEAARQLAADELRHPRMAGDAVEDVAAVLQRRALGIDEAAEHELRPRIVPVGVVVERAVVLAGVGEFPVVVVDRPAGECRRGLVDVDIRVPDRIVRILRAGRHLERIHEAQVVLGAEGVQLEQFAGEVLVRARTAVRLVVEVDHHRRAARHVLQHPAEVAEGIGADHVAVVMAVDRAAVVVADHHVEMVVPEGVGDLEQLPLREHRAHQRLALDFPARTHAHPVLHVGADMLAPLLGQGLAQRGVAGIRQAGGHGAIVDGGGIELPVDPRGQARDVAAAQGVEFGDRFGRGTVAHVVEHAHGEGRGGQGEQAPWRGLLQPDHGAGRRRGLRIPLRLALVARRPRETVTLAMRALQRGALRLGEARVHTMSL